MLAKLSNLPDDFYVRVKGLSRILNKTREINSGTWSGLAKEIGCKPCILYNILSRHDMIQIKLLRSISLLNKKDLDYFTPDIVSIKCIRSTKPVKNFFKVNSVKLCDLLGHAFGDGSIKTQGSFNYTNNESSLLSHVDKLVFDIFGVHPGNGGKCSHEYGTTVGRILNLLGCPRGNKTLEPTNLPKCITNGSDQEKSIFLRSLFDDEGTVTGHFIRIAQAKISECIESHWKYMEDICKILNDLNIQTNKISEFGDYIY